MNRAIGVKLSYFDKLKNQMIQEEYSSLYECAKHYQVSVPSLKKIIEGKNKRVKLFKDDTDFQIQFIDPIPKVHKFTEKKTIWHCDLCDLDFKVGSKANHLLSIKHRKKIVGEK